MDFPNGVGRRHKIVAVARSDRYGQRRMSMLTDQLAHLIHKLSNALQYMLLI